ncbi:MAG: LysE/ArgO family amino acid transporter [Dermatophilaceae bacterium]
MTTLNLDASALAGLGLGLGLIVAIGAQNAFVLRQGIRHEHVLAVVLVCIASDAVLIVAGVAGAGALFTAVPWLLTVARWGGALFLFGYAVLAARRAVRPASPGAEALRIDPDPVDGTTRDGGEGMRHDTASPLGHGGGNDVGIATLEVDARPATAVDAPGCSRPLPAVVATALALTWLNPHVYLDTVVLLGSVGSAHGQARWAFAAGAVLGSLLWFTALGVAARALAPLFARPIAWRVLDGIIAVVMTCVAAGLIGGS